MRVLKSFVHSYVFATIFLLAIVVASAVGRAEDDRFEVPPLGYPVQDDVGFFSSSFVSKFSEQLKSLKLQGGPQIQILVLPYLRGLTIEEASIKVMDKWKLGDQKRDDGILILIADKERKVRIEVGQGLEGALPDIEAKHIIEDLVVPQLKKGRREPAVVAAVQSILHHVRKEYPENAEFQKAFANEAHSAESSEGFSLSHNLLVFIFMVFFILIRLFFGGWGGPRRDGGSGIFYGGGSGRGWGGGGSSGGWSGGGGGFSGGGASGDW
jgi:uncharacterized protein